MHAQIVASGQTVYETPASVFDPLDAEFHFTVDVCATAGNHQVSRYWDEDANGLEQSWAGERCWMNPPYGRTIDQWVRKAYHESRQRGALVVALVPSSTDTRWWHNYIEGKAEVRFVKGRIKFVGARWTAPHPHAIVIWRSQSSSQDSSQ